MSAPRTPTKFDKQLGGILRLARLKNDLSQKQIGELCSVSLQQIQKYERGINRLSVERFIILCKAVNLCPIKTIADATAILEREINEKI